MSTRQRGSPWPTTSRSGTRVICVAPREAASFKLWERVPSLRSWLRSDTDTHGLCVHHHFEQYHLILQKVTGSHYVPSDASIVGQDAHFLNF